jgi:hypothetical protein
MPPRTYRVHVVRGDQGFEVEGDKAFVLAMLKRFNISTESILPVETPTDRKIRQVTVGASGVVGKSLSPGEFIRQLGFKKHTDIVLAFGYYLEHMKGAKDFTPADVNNVYYDAKMENSNTSQMCINNVRKSLMMEAKVGAKSAGKKRYTLTQSGEDYVTKRLAKQPV